VLCALKSGAKAGEDMTTQEAAVDALGTLAGTNQEQAALSQLLMLANSEYELRQHVASALQHFDDPQAKEILSQLRQDSNHRVVATALENLLLTINSKESDTVRVD